MKTRIVNGHTVRLEKITSRWRIQRSFRLDRVPDEHEVFYEVAVISATRVIQLGVIRSHDGPSRTGRGNTRWFTWYESWVAVRNGDATNWSESLKECLWENVR